MPATLVESNENGRIVYDSLVVSDPAVLSAFNNKLSLRIIKVLSENPSCALDIARKLKVHEQKVYYHLRNLEKTGIVYTISSERRHGMIAKIYSVVSPVIAAKLFEKGVEIKDSISLDISTEASKFFSPFIENGRLNAKIIIGAPYPHGKYEGTARHGIGLMDLGIFLGSLIKENNNLNYLLDIDVLEHELSNSNLILIGNSKINSVTQRFNSYLPIYFDERKEFAIVSKLTKQTYNDDYDAVILKYNNPLNKDKNILLLAGKRSVGLVSAVIAIKKYISEISKGNIKDKNLIAKVVSGMDRDADGRMDDVKIRE